MAFTIECKPCEYTRISQPFKPGKHKGIDFVNHNTYAKTKIVAVADGTVVAASRGAWDKSYGNMVAIYHGNGNYTNYAHLSKISVKVGQKVKARDQLGLMGTTGNSTGIHLHWEIHLGRKWNRVNGMPYINALSRPSYKVGKEYTLQENMNVRSETNTSTNKNIVGHKKKGTKIVPLEVKKPNGTCWLRIGDKQWICGYSGSKVYVK